MPKMQNAQERRQQEESFRKKKEQEASPSSLLRAVGRSAASARSASEKALKASRAAKALEEAMAPKSTANPYGFCDSSWHWPLGIFGLCPEQYPVANISAPAESYIIGPADRDRFLQGAPAITKTEVSTVTLTEPLTKTHTERPIEWQTKTKPTTKRTHEWSTVVKTVTMPSKRTATVEEFPTVTTTLEKGTTTLWYKTTEHKTSTVTNTVWHTTEVAATATIVGEGMALGSGDSHLAPGVNLSPRGVMFMLWIVAIIALFTGWFTGQPPRVAAGVANRSDDDDDDDNDDYNKRMDNLEDRVRRASTHLDSAQARPKGDGHDQDSSDENGSDNDDGDQDGHDEDDSRPPAPASRSQLFESNFSNSRSYGATPPFPPSPSSLFTATLNKRTSCGITNASPLQTPVKSDDGPEASTSKPTKRRRTPLAPQPLSPHSAQKKIEADSLADYNKRWAEVSKDFGSDSDDDEWEGFDYGDFRFSESRNPSVSTVQAQPETEPAAATARPLQTALEDSDFEAALTLLARSNNDGTVFEKGPSDEGTIGTPTVGPTGPAVEDAEQGRLQQDMPRQADKNDEIVTDDLPVDVEKIARADEEGAASDAADSKVPSDEGRADTALPVADQPRGADEASSSISVDEARRGKNREDHEAVRSDEKDVADGTSGTDPSTTVKDASPVNNTANADEDNKVDDPVSDAGDALPHPHEIIIDDTSVDAKHAAETDVVLGSNSLGNNVDVDRFDHFREAVRAGARSEADENSRAIPTTKDDDAPTVEEAKGVDATSGTEAVANTETLTNIDDILARTNIQKRPDEDDSKDTSLNQGSDIDNGLQSEVLSDLEPIPAQPASSPKGKEVADDYKGDDSRVEKSFSFSNTASAQPEAVDDNASPAEEYPVSGSNTSSGERRPRPDLKVSTKAEKSHPPAEIEEPLSTQPKSAEAALQSTPASNSGTPGKYRSQLPRPVGYVSPAKSGAKLTPTRPESAMSSNSAESLGTPLFNSPSKIARSCNTPSSAASQRLTDSEAESVEEGANWKRKDSMFKKPAGPNRRPTTTQDRSPAPKPPFRV